MEYKRRVITQMYRWYGMKYGFFIGLCFGLAFSLFEPNIFGEIYITLPIAVLSFGLVFSIFGLIFFPLMKSSLIGNQTEPKNEEIMDFLDNRDRFFGGILDSSESGSGSSDGGSSDGGGGD